MRNPVALSIVAPIYNCGGCLWELYSRICAAVEKEVESFELVLVDDCAGDGSWKVIQELTAKDSRVRGVKLSRNFGQHAAMTAGLSETVGERVIVMDCDLQDPPEEIPAFLAKSREGYDIVFGRRRRKSTSTIRRLGGRVFFWLLKTFARSPFDPNIGAFSLLSRKVVDSFLEIKDRDRLYLLILYWLGFRSTTIEYDHGKRIDGASGYSIRALVAAAVDGMFFQTTALLKGIIYLGFGVASAGGGLAIYILASRIFGKVYPGWSSLAVLILVIGGFIILSTGVTGLYIGKVFEQVKGRPLFVVDQILQSEHESIAESKSHRFDDSELVINENESKHRFQPKQAKASSHSE